MKLILKGTTSNGSHATPIAIDNLRNSGATPKVFTNTYYFSSRKVIDNGKEVLEPKWEYMIFYKEVEVYFFDSEMPYYIEEEHIPITKEQCEDVVKNTYKELQRSWEKRRDTEVNFFPSVADLTNETLDLAVRELMKTLEYEP